VRRQIVAPVLLATGHVEADPGRSARVPAKVAGVIEDVLFREGDIVKEGAVLATVRAPGLGGLRADLASLQARTVSAQSNRTRLETLAQRGMASQQELAAARAEATALDAEGRAAKQRLQALGVASTGNASIFSLRAPIAGSITHRDVLARPGRDPGVVVATIVSIDRAWFVARIFEHMLAKVRVGAVAEVQLNAYPDHPFLGTIEHLAATVDAEAQTVVARIPIENREDILRIGLFGSARIATTDPRAEPAPVLAVSRDSVIDVAGKPAVFVRGEGGSFELHEVVLGTSGPGVVEILSGLQEGELVVTRRSLDAQERAAQGHLRRGPRTLAMNLLSAIVAWSLRNRALVLVATLLFIVVGVRAALQLPIDAVPDVTNVQVQIITAAPALSPVEVEQYISGPGRARDVRPAEDDAGPLGLEVRPLGRHRRVRRRDRHLLRAPARSTSACARPARPSPPRTARRRWARSRPASARSSSSRCAARSTR
jgi:cobalt-zinc-cadmium efflux system membrane fusion protein